MATKSKKPAARGFVNNIILQSLVSGDKYGYEIIKEVEEKSNGEIVLKQPSLYSSLKRFEAKNYISSYWGDSDIGGRRHYYSITDEGLAYFETIKHELDHTLLDDEKEATSVLTTPETVKPENKSAVVQQKTKPEEESNEVVDVDSDDYDLFELLNKQTASPLTQEKQAEKPQEDKTSKHVEENEQPTTAQEEPTTPALQVVEEPVVEEQLDEVATEEESHEKLEQQIIEESKEQLNETESESEKSQASSNNNWESLQKIIANRTKVETAKLNQEVQTKEEDEEEPAFVTEMTELMEEEKPLDTTNVTSKEDTTSSPAPKRELRVIVDEFGIMKSEYDSLPKKQPALFDNVGRRLDAVDPVSTTKKVVSQEKEIKFEIDTKPVMEYNDQDKIISEKLSKAVENHKNRTTDLNLKNIIGDFMVSEDEEDWDLPTSHEKAEKENFAFIKEEVPEKPKQKSKHLRATSYSALQDSLKESGFKFKPYEYELKEEKQTTTFMLYNKVKFHLGLALLLLNILTVSIFVLTLAQANYPFKTVDYIVVGLSYAVGALAFLGFALPYFWNAKKRKQNMFVLNQTLLFGVLSFFALSIITYAVNSFVGLNTTNFSDYIITLFLPMIVYLLFILTPLVYHVLVNNKRYY